MIYMKTSIVNINGRQTVVRLLTFEKFCSKFYSYIHSEPLANLQSDYESAKSLCRTYIQLGAYNDSAFANYSFYKTVILYITSQCPSISAMYDVYKADRLKGDTTL